jgi:hypothetical protein
LAEVFSIIKHPIIYREKQYYVTINEIDDDRCYHGYIESKVYILNEGKFKLFKYKKIYDSIFNFDEWRGKYKKLMEYSIKSYFIGIEWDKEKIKKKNTIRDSGLVELDNWNGNLK